MQLATPTLTPTTPGKISFNMKPKTPVTTSSFANEPSQQSHQPQQPHQPHQPINTPQIKSPKSQRHEQLKTFLQHNTPPVPPQQVNNYAATAPILDHMSSFFSAPAKHQ